MQEVFEKIIKKMGLRAEKSEKKEMDAKYFEDAQVYKGERTAFRDAIEIVKQEADLYKDFDMEFAKKCVELAEKMNVCDLVAENCRLSNENRFFKLKEYNNGWIPCSDAIFPKENEKVRVTIWDSREMIGFRRDGKWFVYGSDGISEATVLAWQHTQPYQPKGEKNATV